ncbi:MAG: hypothetical protein Q8L09_02995 [Candidatus Moranbacteria bacterium]|nr:hypothetical protein [Candidatus Moranbacteria bacterium]
MKLKIYNRTSIIFAFFILTGVLSYIFSRTSCAGGLVPCTDDCNFCYLLVGISNIFLYLAGSLLTAAVLLGIVIGGMIYMVAGLFPQALNFAKLAFSVSLKALAIALCGWLAINSVMNIVGYKHPAGGKWWQHECATSVTSASGSEKNTNEKNIFGIIQ